MKNSISTLIILLTLNSCTQEKLCTDYKVGEFEYTDPKFSEWIVKRTDSTQTETSSKSGIEIYSSIEWKSDCEYILTYKKVVNAEPKNLIGTSLYVEITKIKSDRYTCISKSDVFDMELEMVKTK